MRPAVSVPPRPTPPMISGARDFGSGGGAEVMMFFQLMSLGGLKGPGLLRSFARRGSRRST